ncbi:MAG TPA: hypothetical protein VFE05_12680 [Longimicrobiaceae bacterium]|nr:hypothetical protein [Longimicrobiaceae bacterium]
MLTLDHTDLPAGIIAPPTRSRPGTCASPGRRWVWAGRRAGLTLRFTLRGAIGQQSFGVKVEELAGRDFADLTAQVAGRVPFFHATGR